VNEKDYLRTLRQLWEKNWPRHLPKEPHYPFGMIPLTKYLLEWAERKPNAPVLIYYGNEITFQQLEEMSDRFAAFLSARGLKKGDKVAVFLPNCPQFHIAFYGTLKLGCVHVPVNPMFKEMELLYELNDSEAQVIVTLDQLYPIVKAVKDKTQLREIVTTSLSDYLPENPAIPIHESMVGPKIDTTGAIDMATMLAKQPPYYPDHDVELDDVVALNYTGGTTGLPKGCEHTQRDMIYTAATMSTYTMEQKEGDVSLVYIPIFWIAGENSGLITPVFTGNPCVLLTRWDAEAVLTAIDRYHVSHTGGTVDNMVELMEHPNVSDYNLKSVRVALVMSFVKKMNVTYRRKWSELAGPDSVIREGAYGMTETHTVDTFTNGFQEDDMDLVSEPVFCGLPMPGTEFKIVDFETKEIVPLGEEGEIVVRSPSLLKSYWKKPEATQQSLRDGWFYTGDIGRLDKEGFLHYLGRRKEMLKVNGMSVFPSEIETLLGQHPAIEGSAVVGKPDPDKGEIPVAFVKLRADFRGTVSDNDLAEWCHQNMAVYKVPWIKVVDEFPMTISGKVKKEELKKSLNL
jgi:long-chain acyl-CoA synthetase